MKNPLFTSGDMSVLVGISALAAMLAAGNPGRAAVIGISFYDGAVATVQSAPGVQQTLASTDVAGASASAGWYNNINTTSSAPYRVALLDNTDTVTGATVTINTLGNGNGNGGVAANGLNLTFSGGAGYDAWNWTSTSLDGDQKMFNGFVTAANNNSHTLEIALANIPYSSYSVYLYGQTDSAQGGSVQDFIGTGTSNTAGAIYYIGPTAANPYNYGNNHVATSYVQATGTTLGTQTNSSNYVVFTGLTTPSQLLDVVSTAGTFAISGVEIVSVPEPASLALLALGGMLLLPRRRHARA
jgi:hypothetical protein